MDTADLVKYISPGYSPACFQIRNEWMVEHSSRVIAVYSGSRGGTRNTLKYAEAKDFPSFKYKECRYEKNDYVRYYDGAVSDRCGAKPQVSQQETEPTQVISTVSTENCFLCGSGAEEPFYWEQNNVGIINLNIFEVMPIVINHYDNHGVLIEKNTGCLTSHGLYNDDNGLCAYVYEDADWGHASGSITFNEDEILDVEKTATFLCQDCLDTVLSEIHERGFGAGVINFSTREIRPFEACFGGFGLGDYYIDLDWKEKKDAGKPQEVGISVLYCPLRYDEDE